MLQLRKDPDHQPSIHPVNAAMATLCTLTPTVDTDVPHGRSVATVAQWEIITAALYSGPHSLAQLAQLGALDLAATFRGLLALRSAGLLATIVAPVRDRRTTNELHTYRLRACHPQRVEPA